MAEKSLNNKRTKHIDIRYHFIRQHVIDKTIELFHVPTAKNIADIMTKALTGPTFQKFVKMIFRLDE